jgi:hypothetical protein
MRKQLSREVQASVEVLNGDKICVEVNQILIKVALEAIRMKKLDAVDQRVSNELVPLIPTEMLTGP